MRLAPACLAASGILIGWLGQPTIAHAASVWVTLAAGLPGSEAATSSSEFHFDNPHAPNIAVSEISGGLGVEAVTGGGNSFFGGAGVPVLLNLADGSAYLASGSAPSAARTAGAGSTPASGAPVAGGSLPSNAALLGVKLAEPSDGTRALTATITDSTGNTLGTGSLSVPDGGWWVLGLTPELQITPDPGPVNPPPVDSPPPIDPRPDPFPSTPPPTSNPVATPEPATLLMAAIGGAAIHAWRRSRSKFAPV